MSSQTDPVRGIGAATAWVYQQMQAIAATSSGRMTVQQQSFVQPASSRIPVPTTITNVIATLQGTASPERFYVVTGHLDSRVTDVLDFTKDAPVPTTTAPAWRSCSSLPGCSPPISFLRERRAVPSARPVRPGRGTVRPD